MSKITKEMQEMLDKNLLTAMLEVEEHTSHGGVQVLQLESKDIDKQKFIKDVTWYINQDKDLRDYYTDTDIYLAVTKHLQ